MPRTPARDLKMADAGFKERQSQEGMVDVCSLQLQKELPFEDSYGAIVIKQSCPPAQFSGGGKWTAI